MSTTTERNRATSENGAASSTFSTVQCLQPLSGDLAEHPLQLSAGASVDAADDYECYECYAPYALIVVALEPAATSPFMDA